MREGTFPLGELPSSVTIIANPQARRLPSRRSLNAAIEWLRGLGIEAHVLETSAPEEATSLARTAAEGSEVVVACGGDGTINEVVNGLAGTPAAMAAIRGGTANIWANEIGLPRTPRLALERQLGGVPVHVDLGLTEGRYFLLMAGMGLDARVVARISPREKRLLGPIAFALRAVESLGKSLSAPATVLVDGSPVYRGQTALVVVANVGRYGVGLRLAPRAQPTDGLLDVCWFSGESQVVAWRQMALALVGRHVGSAGVGYAQGERVEIETEADLPVQVDGELLMGSPRTFTLQPRALKVLAPVRTASRLVFG